MRATQREGETDDAWTKRKRKNELSNQSHARIRKRKKNAGVDEKRKEEVEDFDEHNHTKGKAVQVGKREISTTREDISFSRHDTEDLQNSQGLAEAFATSIAEGSFYTTHPNIASSSAPNMVSGSTPIQAITGDMSNSTQPDNGGGEMVGKKIFKPTDSLDDIIDEGIDWGSPVLRPTDTELEFETAFQAIERPLNNFPTSPPTTLPNKNASRKNHVGIGKAVVDQENDEDEGEETPAIESKLHVVDFLTISSCAQDTIFIEDTTGGNQTLIGLGSKDHSGKLGNRFIVPTVTPPGHKLKATLFNFIEALPELPAWQAVDGKWIFAHLDNELVKYTVKDLEFELVVFSNFEYLHADVARFVTARATNASQKTAVEVKASWAKGYWKVTPTPTKEQCAAELKRVAATMLQNSWDEYGPTLQMENRH